MATQPIFTDVQPWPEAKAAPAVDRHHNKPPLEELIPIEFREALLADVPQFLERLDQLLGVPGTEDTPAIAGAVHRAKCDDDETLGLCGSLVNTLRKCEQHVEATHKTVKAPYLEGGRLVDAQKNAIAGRIMAGRQMIEGLQQAYARKRQQEAAEQRARETEERRKLEELARENNLETAMPPPTPEPVRAAPIRSDDGATVSLGTVWCSQVEDYVKAFKHVKDDANVRAAVDKAIQSIVKATKGQKPLTGVRIFEDVKIGNR